MNLGKSLRNTRVSLLVFLLIQAGAGVAAVLTQLPLQLVMIHNAIAAMLLLAVVNLKHLLTPSGNPVQP
jgi:heme A synthase